MNTLNSKTYEGLQRAYDHFNATLFDKKLPQSLITLSEHRTARGYHRPEAIVVSKDKTISEISLNPFTFKDRTNVEILSTLVHEMTHLWQHTAGTPGKGVHNKEWADKMEELGLMPTSTGAEGGKRTGRKVTHYIIKGGAFAVAAAKIKDKITFHGVKQLKEKGKPRRTKFICQDCDANAYGKPSLNLICGDCEAPMKAATT